MTNEEDLLNHLSIIREITINEFKEYISIEFEYPYYNILANYMDIFDPISFDMVEHGIQNMMYEHIIVETKIKHLEQILIEYYTSYLFPSNKGKWIVESFYIDLITLIDVLVNIILEIIRRFSVPYFYEDFNYSVYSNELTYFIEYYIKVESLFKSIRNEFLNGVKKVNMLIEELQKIDAESLNQYYSSLMNNISKLQMTQIELKKSNFQEKLETILSKNDIKVNFSRLDEITIFSIFYIVVELNNRKGTGYIQLIAFIFFFLKEYCYYKEYCFANKLSFMSLSPFQKSINIDSNSYTKASEWLKLMQEITYRDSKTGSKDTAYTIILNGNTARKLKDSARKAYFKTIRDLFCEYRCLELETFVSHKLSVL